MTDLLQSIHSSILESKYYFDTTDNEPADWIHLLSFGFSYNEIPTLLGLLKHFDLNIFRMYNNNIGADVPHRPLWAQPYINLYTNSLAYVTTLRNLERKTLLFYIMKYLYGSMPNDLINILREHTHGTLIERLNGIAESLLLDYPCVVNNTRSFCQSVEFRFNVSNSLSNHILSLRKYVTFFDLCNIADSIDDHISNFVTDLLGATRIRNKSTVVIYEEDFRTANMITYKGILHLIPLERTSGSACMKDEVNMFKHLYSGLKSGIMLSACLDGKLDFDNDIDFNQLQNCGTLGVKQLMKTFVSEKKNLDIKHEFSWLRPGSRQSLTSEQKKSFNLVTQNTKSYADVVFVPLVSPVSTVLLSPYVFNCTTEIFGNTDKWNEAKKYRGGIIGNNTGSGKTLLVFAICSTQKSSLIVVPDTLVSHWKSEIVKHTLLTLVPSEWEDYVLVISKSKDIPRKTQIDKCPTMVIISRSAFRSKHWQLYRHRNFDQIFIEEAHNLNPNCTIYSQLVSHRVKTRWAISATPYENYIGILSLIGYTNMLSCLNIPIHVFKSIPVLSHFTCREKTILNNVTLVKSKIYCSQSQLEKKFFHQVVEIIQNVSVTRLTNLSGITRVFRILERISAGGQLNGELMIRILRYYLSPKRQREENISIMSVKCTQEAFCTRDDDCVICLDKFSSPLQLACGHVFCKLCITSMVHIGGRKCPMCRKVWNLPLQLWCPLWAEISHSDTSTVDLNLSTYFTMLNNGDEKLGNVIQLKGKFEKFKLELSKRNERCGPLVIFVKRSKPAQQYFDEMKSRGLSVLVAGINGCNITQSIRNIEHFRQGKSKILLASIKYSTGFDLNMASDLWIMDYDLNVAKIEQCQGRCMRLGQINNIVNIKLFLYQNAFDDFLCTFQHIGCFSPTKANFVLLQYFLLHKTPGNIFYDAKNLGQHIFGRNIYITTNSDNIIINNLLKVRVSDKSIEYYRNRESIAFIRALSIRSAFIVRLRLANKNLIPI